jgi:hypothetical protein
MSAKEMNVWIADSLIEPWGDDREDIRSGMIVQSNLMPHSKKEVKLKNCIVNFEPPKKQTWQQMSAMLKGYTMAMKGKNGNN